MVPQRPVLSYDGQAATGTSRRGSANPDQMGWYSWQPGLFGGFRFSRKAEVDVCRPTFSDCAKRERQSLGLCTTRSAAFSAKLA
jgi:hypothetical protein